MINFFRKNYLFLMIAILGIILDIGSKAGTFALLGGNIFVPELVGKIPSTYSKYLVTGQISEDLLTQVNQHIPIPKYAILRLTYHQECWISSANGHYLLIPKGNEILLTRSKYPIPEEYDVLGTRLLSQSEYRPYPIIPRFFSLRLAFNLGAVWSSFEGQTLLLILFSIVAIVFIFYLLLFHSYPRSYQIFLGMILAGAFGNLWDRIYFGGVRDFLDFYIGRYHWPTFNIADCLIIIGVAFFVWFEWKKPENQSGKKA